MEPIYKAGDYVAVHTNPVWRSEANYVFQIYLGNTDGRDEWEQLWGKVLKENKLLMCCIPFFAYDIALGDEVEISPEGYFRRVSKEGGQITYRAWFGGANGQMKKTVVAMMTELASSSEWSSQHLLAVSVDADQSQAMANYLYRCQQDGYLQYEIGRSK